MSSVPEPTEAMVEANRGALWAGWGAPRQTTDWPSRGQLSEALQAAIAAAPPEWLLRAALSEGELKAAEWAISAHAWDHKIGGDTQKVFAKLSRGLRGGEENDG